MWRKSKRLEREIIYEKIKRDFEKSKKDVFYYRLHDLITNDNIFSKLSYTLMNRRNIGSFDSASNHLKNCFIIPILFLWKIFLIRFERFYYKIKSLNFCTLQDVKNDNFDYLFVLNTSDHIITALPVLEGIDNKAKSLVVTFKSVYTKYKNDFDKLKNTKILLFEYELGNLPITCYLRIIKESRSKYRLLESQNLDEDLKRLIAIDKNFIIFHLRTELIQYQFFEKIFNTFDIKGTVAIVFSTAFERCKERGIPTFILQHGIGGKGHGHPYVSDYWFTLDDVSKESLDEWLDHTVNVLALGTPRFEYFCSIATSKKNRNRFNKRIQTPARNKNVTFIASGTKIMDTPKLLLALKSLREKLPSDANLIIKLHPRGEYSCKKDVKKLFSKKELNGTVFLKKEIDFYEILANSDIVITSASTGMLEAIAADIPTIQVNFTKFALPVQYELSSFGWRKPITDHDTLIDEVLLLSDRGRFMEVINKQKWLKKRMFKNFGKCGNVIGDTIITICNERYKG